MSYLKGMKAVILAGGKGTRILEESHNKPKPMIEIEGKPILWHIMKIYDHYGIKDFIICAGHKQHVIKEYFFNYQLFSSDVTINTHDGFQTGITFHQRSHASWNITIVDTGEDAQTVGQYAKNKKISFDILLDSDSKLAEDYALIGVPTFIFINEQGVVKNVEHVIPEDLSKIFG